MKNINFEKVKIYWNILPASKKRFMYIGVTFMVPLVKS